MEITSGELYFRRTYGWHGGLLAPHVNLKKTADTSESITQAENRLSSIMSLHLQARKAFRARLISMSKDEPKLLSLKFDRMIQLARSRRETLSISLDQEVSRTDKVVKYSVMHYLTILKEELQMSRGIHRGDDNLAASLARQARIKHDLLLFAYSLKRETKGSICIHNLMADTPQYKRCKKAAIESTAVNFFGMNPELNSLNVVNIFKLENRWLSGQLQRAAKAVDNAKVKGLFCYVSKRDVYALSVFGLYSQSIVGLPELSLENSINAELKRMGSNRHLKIFTSPWFAALDETLKDGPSKLSRARELATSSRLCHLRFRRSSTPTITRKLTSSEMDDGLYLTLCRVLISKLRVVEGQFDYKWAPESVAMGYDAIYFPET
jgi:hypothetical protein